MNDLVSSDMNINDCFTSDNHKVSLLLEVNDMTRCTPFYGTQGVTLVIVNV